MLEAIYDAFIKCKKASKLLFRRQILRGYKRVILEIMAQSDIPARELFFNATQALGLLTGDIRIN